MLSSAQIIDLSCQMCKVPGYTQQAGMLLNMVLEDLAQVYDFDTERKTIDIPVDNTNQYYDLPADHLRTREVFFSISGAVTMLQQLPLEQYDQMFKGTSALAYPTSYATQVEADPHRLLLFPTFVQSLTLTVRYQPFPDPIPNPETNSVIPWFPNQNVLLKKLNSAVSMLADDDRMVSFDTIATNNLSDFLSMKDDSNGYAKTVKLDGRQFRGSRLRPTKITPF